MEEIKTTLIMATKLKLILIHMIFLNGLSSLPIAGIAQCTPVNCLDSLPAYGGICMKSYVEGRVNHNYFDFASFHITSSCLDAGMLDSTYKGKGARILKLHTFKVTGLPAGLTSTSDRTEYSAPANGCAGITGIPTEAGKFKVSLQMQINIRAWPFSSTCSGIVSLDLNNLSFGGSFNLLILPDAGFSGLDTAYCMQDPAVTLTPTGTPGGTFSGPGVSGDSFSPSLAGPGKHQIRYRVTAQQGAAVSPATADSVYTVKVRDCTGSAIREIADDQFTLYPNPASDRIILETYALKNGAFRIYSIHGMIMLQQKLIQSRTEIGIGNFAPGVYFVVVTDQNSTIVKRFVKE